MIEVDSVAGCHGPVDGEKFLGFIAIKYVALTKSTAHGKARDRDVRRLKWKPERRDDEDARLEICMYNFLLQRI